MQNEAGIGKSLVLAVAPQLIASVYVLVPLRRRPAIRTRGWLLALKLTIRPFFIP